MKIRIYQINNKRDDKDVAFVSYTLMQKYSGKSEVTSDIYDKVFDGNVATGGLESIFALFNLACPEGHVGHSMSTSDVVELIHEDGTSSFHYCDSFGFRNIDFKPEETVSAVPEKRMIDVVVCEPGKKAYKAQVEDGLPSLQKVVGGPIECIYPFDDPVILVCNDEGKFNGMKPSRGIYDENGELVDIVCGTFFICGMDEDNFRSLRRDELKEYMEKFMYPEVFVDFGGKVKGLKVMEEF